MKKVIIIVSLITITFFIHFVLQKFSFGIVLPFGWRGTCYGYTYSGFPFSEVSLPRPGTLCIASDNFIGLLLNYTLIFLIVFTFYRFIRLKTQTKQRKCSGSRSFKVKNVVKNEQSYYRRFIISSYFSHSLFATKNYFRNNFTIRVAGSVQRLYIYRFSLFGGKPPTSRNTLCRFIESNRITSELHSYIFDCVYVVQVSFSQDTSKVGRRFNPLQPLY